jgi:hypothetical protein
VWLSPDAIVSASSTTTLNPAVARRYAVVRPGDPRSHDADVAFDVLVEGGQIGGGG